MESSAPFTGSLSSPRSNSPPDTAPHWGGAQRSVLRRAGTALPGLQALRLDAPLSPHLAQELPLPPRLLQDHLLGPQLLLLQLFLQGIGSVKAEGRRPFPPRWRPQESLPRLQEGVRLRLPPRALVKGGLESGWAPDGLPSPLRATGKSGPWPACDGGQSAVPSGGSLPPHTGLHQESPPACSGAQAHQTPTPVPCPGMPGGGLVCSPAAPWPPVAEVRAGVGKHMGTKEPLAQGP